jgi:hypothetical protein
LKNIIILSFLSLITAGGIHVIQKNMRSQPVAAAVLETSPQNLLIILPMMLVVGMAMAMFFCYLKQR